MLAQVISQPSAASARSPQRSKPSSDPSGGDDAPSSHHHSSHAAASPPAAVSTPWQALGNSAASVHDEGPSQASAGGLGAGRPFCAAGGVDGGGVGIGGYCCGTAVGGSGGWGDAGQD